MPPNTSAAAEAKASKLHNTLRALAASFSPRTVDRLRSDPERQATLDAAVTLLRPNGDNQPRAPPPISTEAALMSQLRPIAEASPSSLKNLLQNPSGALSTLLKSTATRLGLAEATPAASQASSPAPAANGQTNPIASPAKGHSKQVASMLDFYNDMITLPPVTPTQYLALFHAGYALNLKREEREATAWSRATRGYHSAPAPEDHRATKKLWYNTIASVVGDEANSQDLLDRMPVPTPPDDEEDLEQAISCHIFLQSLQTDTTTTLLVHNVLALLAAIEFAHLHQTRSDTAKQRIVDRCFAEHPVHGKAVAHLKDDPERLRKHIEDHAEADYTRFKKNEHERDMTGRRRALFAYHKVGLCIFLDPAFSPSLLRGSTTSPAYPKFVDAITANFSLIPGQRYEENRAAVIGALGAINVELARRVKALEQHIPSSASES